MIDKEKFFHKIDFYVYAGRRAGLILLIFGLPILFVLCAEQIAEKIGCVQGVANSCVFFGMDIGGVLYGMYDNFFSIAWFFYILGFPAILFYLYNLRNKKEVSRDNKTESKISNHNK